MKGNYILNKRKLGEKIVELNTYINLAVLDDYIDNLHNSLESLSQEFLDKQYKYYMETRTIYFTRLEENDLDDLKDLNETVVKVIKHKRMQVLQQDMEKFKIKCYKAIDVHVKEFDDKHVEHVREELFPLAFHSNNSELKSHVGMFVNEISNKLSNITNEVGTNVLTHINTTYISYIESLFDIEMKLLEVVLSKNAKAKQVKEELDVEVKLDTRNIYDYKTLNKLASEYGFVFDRQKGDHGQFIHKKTGQLVTIPQGRSIGRGLSIAIQKQLQENSVTKCDRLSFN